MFNPDFYPTPKHLIERMLEGIDVTEVQTWLEPSAGKGDLADFICERWNHRNYRYSETKEKPDIDVIEIVPELQHILKGKGYRVVHDDFLSFETFKRYDVIIMNPPFSNGEKHLLKALELQKDGGRVISLLNAATIKTAFPIDEVDADLDWKLNKYQKDLVQKLREYEAEIEYIAGAFKDAERPTGVEVALVRVNIPAREQRSVIIEGLRQEEYFAKTTHGDQALIEADPIAAIIARYKFEVKAGLRLIDEYEAMIPYLYSTVKAGAKPVQPIFELRMDGARQSITRNQYIMSVRDKYWTALFMSDIFMNHFTSDLRKQYINKVNELVHYDFSLYNIRTIQAEIIKTMTSSIEDTIIALFDEFSHKYHWHEETGNNIHYYNGWATNKAWYINKKVIILLRAFDEWRGDYTLRLLYNVSNKLTDIEKVFDFLDGGRSNHVDLMAILRQAEGTKQTRKIPLKYFNVTVYKKGTCHIEFTNLELLKKFNLYGSQRKGWLPPSYGKKSYREMTPAEKAVVDSFEGEKEYSKVLKNKDYYFVDTKSLLMLESKGA
jgi:hypothetical protein